MHAVQRPAGLSTPSSATLACSGGMHTPASAPASAAQPWQQLQGPVSPAPQIVVRQLSLPSHPPSPLLLAGSTSPVAAAPAGELWAAVPPATLAAQLAPSLPFYECSQVAARCEAERQLTLLQQLKASMAVGGSSAAASSCGSPSGGLGQAQTEGPPVRWLPGEECCACQARCAFLSAYNASQLTCAQRHCIMSFCSAHLLPPPLPPSLPRHPACHRRRCPGLHGRPRPLPHAAAKQFAGDC